MASVVPTQIVQAQVVDTVVEDMTIEDCDMTNIEFLNKITKELNLHSGYSTLGEFIDYADEHYTHIDNFHMEGSNLIWNSKLVQQSSKTDIVFIVSHGQVYVVNDSIENIDSYINVTMVNSNSVYKNYEVAFTDIVDENSRIYTVEPFMKPLKSISVNDNWGYRTDPINGGTAYHSGVDLQASTGTKIYATEKGTVKTVSYGNSGYGNYVEIDHGDGYTTLYAHCSELLVKEGQVVYAGDLIAKSGATGRVTGAHLHFEYRHNGESLDPMKYINEQTLCNCPYK